MPTIETRETITPAIKAHSDKVKACGQYSIANPTVPLKDNPHFDPAEERRLLKAAFGTAQVEYMCPCGYLTPRINSDLIIVHEEATFYPDCSSNVVIVRRRVRKPKGN